MTRVLKPRLLPTTICVLAFVLASKCTVLVRAAIQAGQPADLITTAVAATDAPAAKPAERKAETKAATPDAAKPEDATANQENAAPITDGERTVLLELRQRRQELDAREARVSARESVLVAAEMKLSSRVEELRALQQRLESMEAERKQQEDTAWQGLVKVYESMKPRDAAAIFNDLGMPVLLAVVDRMKETKAAAILAAMAPDKARDVTTQLAILRSKSGAVTGAKPTISAEPGKPPGSGT
jgi:flagellar motility protein MotE (MotC chaperone)